VRFPRQYRILFLSVFCLLLIGCSGGDAEKTQPSDGPDVSGLVEGGLRVLTFDPAAQGQQFTVYRGDYVRARMTNQDSFTIRIAALQVEKRFPVTDGEKPYFKVPDAGRFEFSLGDAGGVIQALEYKAAGYRELSSTEAAELIANIDPLIVDVRTAGEYRGGHLENARLVPVQEFQRRIGEMSAHKNEPVFVYCRTGNRSTVAAKILVDNGYTNVLNLRRGIVEWRHAGLSIVR
jgi:rhodanese-related sulfurtransferase